MAVRLPTITPEAAKKLAAGPYAVELLRTVGSYTVPIGWVLSADSSGQKLQSGTAFFVKTPTTLFGVTANHVVSAFFAAKVLRPSTTCHLLDQPFDLESAIISRGARIDIATFRVSESLIATLGKQPATGWPPEMPIEGRGILFAGFPGVERQQIARGVHSFGLYCGNNLVHRVDDDKITSEPMHKEDLVDALGLGLPADDYDIGGMSGGPVLKIIETSVVSWCLAGVISQGLSFGHVFYAARADCIDSFGIVRG